jgi:DNA-binding transcriptional LysR family regulator
MLIKHLAYLVALDKEKHFGRAAAECRVSQPSLSAAIRQLEIEFGVPIVERGQRFQGFTQEGRIILDWARRILSDCDGLKQELGAMRQGLSGRLRIGVVPTAIPMVGLISAPFYEKYPQVSIMLLSKTSIEIQAGLDNFELELGLTYLDNEPLSDVRSIPLYTERYYLLTGPASGLGERDTVTWAEAAALQLCLLTPNMQNRRIIDDIFRRVDCAPAIEVEANSMTALWAHVKAGPWSTVVPKQFVDLLGTPPGTRAYRLVEPDVTHVMGFVAPKRDPASPLAAAMLSIALRLPDEA